MNKKVNTLLFILGATIFNVIITVALFSLLFLLYINFLIPLLPEAGQAWSFPLLIIAAIVLSFFVYRFVLKILMKKIPIDKYFDPIFGKRK